MVEELVVDGRTLSLREFVALAMQRDTAFQEILVDTLALAYRRDLRLPARDLVASVTHRMQFFLDQDREEPDTAVSLSKDFPLTGSSLEAAYDVSPRATSSDSTSEVSVTFSQAIAQNAFGRATRLLDRIVGLEVDVARHQIVEAYEDYLASLVLAYLNWYSAHENLKIAESSYRENLKLLDNILEREKSRIALPVDVNKIRLQVMAKEERLVELVEQHQNRLNTIRTAMRVTGEEALAPEAPESQADPGDVFELAFSRFEEASRTYDVLRLLEQQSGLEVDKEADDLLPSIDLLVGYELTGTDYGVDDAEGAAFAGVSIEWPFPDQVDRAEYETEKLDHEKTLASIDSTHHRLYTQLKNLHLAIGRERRLAEIAQEKIRLAREVLEAETENYTYGKVTLNDYIDAVNVLDNNRFSHVTHSVLLQALLVEWRRLTDTLVSQADVAETHPRYVRP